jgi:hypothetical protein
MNLRRSTVLLVLLTLVLAACGAGQVLAPRMALREAAQATSNQDRTVMTVSLVGAEKDVNALVNEGKALTAEDRRGLELLRSSRLTISTDRGAGAKSHRDDRSAFALNLGDVKDAMEVRIIDGVLYARADVAGVTKLFEVPAEAVAEAVTGVREAGFGFVADAAAGHWLEADLNLLAPKGKTGAGADPTGPGLSGLAAGQTSKLMDAFTATWGQDVKVTRLQADGTGDHYRLDVPMRRVYERLLPALGGLTGVPGLNGLPAAAEVPDRTASAEVWVTDGRIVRGELDLTQFASQKAGRVALRVDVSPLKDDVKTPSGTVKVDVKEIFSRFFGGFPGTETSIPGIPN